MPAALVRRLVDFLADRRGLSAVEFALLLPLMLTLYLGGVEVSNGVALTARWPLRRARSPTSPRA